MGGSRDIDIIVSSPKKVVSVKLDVEIIDEIDRVWRSLGYSNRSEFLREAILFYLQFVKKRGASVSTAIRGEGAEAVEAFMDAVEEYEGESIEEIVRDVSNLADTLRRGKQGSRVES